ncbi:MAG: class I SAM-dependent methyltransferase [Candidatus Bathyarchaeia archaeon]
MAIREGEDFINFDGTKIGFSRIEYVENLIERNPKVSTRIVGLNEELFIPFTAALLSRVDPWTQLFLFSRLHRLLIISHEFGVIAKPFAKWLVKKMATHDRKKMDLVDLESYAPIYGKLFEVHAPLEYRMVKQIVNPSVDASILEVGCATGNLALMLANDARKVVGIDLAKHLIAHAEKQKQMKGILNCEFKLSEYPRTALQEEFDYLVSMNLHFSMESMRGHIFPAKKVLVGGFTHNKLDFFSSREKINKMVQNFSDNYSAKIFSEKCAEFGEDLTFDLIYLEKI